MMKKLICAMLAALLACLPAAALADVAAMDSAVIDAFSKTWIPESGEGYSVDIWWDEEEGGFDVLALRAEGESAFYSVEFEKCEYDAEGNALICGGGTLLYDSGISEELDEDEEAPEEVLASGFDATLTLIGGQLRWTDSGESLAEGLYVPENEDDGLFVGQWECGDDWSMFIEMRSGVYTVSIDQTIGDMEWASWEYTGALDPAGALNCTGAKNLVTGFGEEDDYDEVSVPAYADGGATFTLTGDAILWDDAMEDAGRDLLFVRSPEEVVDDDDDVIDEDGNSVAD